MGSKIRQHLIPLWIIRALTNVKSAVYVQESSISRRSACGAALRNSQRPSSHEEPIHPPPEAEQIDLCLSFYLVRNPGEGKNAVHLYTNAWSYSERGRADPSEKNHVMMRSKPASNVTLNAVRLAARSKKAINNNKHILIHEWGYAATA